MLFDRDSTASRATEVAGAGRGGLPIVGRVIQISSGAASYNTLSGLRLAADRVVGTWGSGEMGRQSGSSFVGCPLLCRQSTASLAAG